jgi:Transposase IS4
VIVIVQMPQLGLPSQVIGDSTNPARTLRPNLPPEPETGDNYNPMPHPNFDFEIRLLKDVNRKDPVAIFDLFYSPEQLAILVASTNKFGRNQSQIGPRCKRALEWTDITIGELYAYLGILIYMSLHIENRTSDYWAIDPKRPSHLPVRNAMSRERFQQISLAFHIAELGKSAFSKVI